MRKKRFLSILLSGIFGVAFFVSCGENVGDFTNSSDSNIQSSAQDSTSGDSLEHTHDYGNVWENNAYTHWRVCECGEKADLDKHTGEATCTEKAVCTVCGKSFGNISGHTYGELMDIQQGVKGYSCGKCGNSTPLATIEKDNGEKVEGLLDFVVEVETGRDPIVLQLSDPQLMNLSQAEDRCYKYIRETISETNPDLILITGDLVYGQYDPTGEIWTEFISFMEGFEIPWAPVLGNHDNECAKGAEWQNEQLENAKYCLFERGSVTGNGNYSVGVLQGDTLLRVFYMMDTHGCLRTAGFTEDQIDWYESSIKEIRKVESGVQLSFAYHIQQAYFIKAYGKYGDLGDGSSVQENPVNFDALEGVEEGDFGYLGRAMKSAWDTDYRIFMAMKQLGVDSIFCGHEHCNSASVVFEGIRFQYGQKSSTYDRYNAVDKDGNIIGSYGTTGTTPLIGGTVFLLSQTDGAIIDPHIYLYGDVLGTNPKS